MMHRQHMIEIDGSYGEGGGQILRTALSLSCLQKKPIRIFNIRKGRRKPGLMAQHLTAVRAAQLLSSADVKGDNQGSTELFFTPKEVRGGNFVFDIGTAGSTLLVLQTIIPPLIFQQEETVITLTGGTHVPFSPSYDYVNMVYMHYLRQIGIDIKLSIESYGFYPRGGGKIRAEIFPVDKLKSFHQVDRGRVLRLQAISATGNLPLYIAERQKDAMLARVLSEEGMTSLPVDVATTTVPTPGQGTFIFLKAESEGSCAGFTALGAKGKKAEAVGQEVADAFLEYDMTGASLDPYISDQIVVFLASLSEESVFTTSRITRHLITNLRIIELFQNYSFRIEGEIGNPGKVLINLAL